MTDTTKSEQLAFQFPERLFTIKAAAERFGLPEYKLQRAVRAELIPSYTLYNSRRLVKMSEVVAVIDATRQGGQS